MRRYPFITGLAIGFGVCALGFYAWLVLEEAERRYSDE